MKHTLNLDRSRKRALKRRLDIINYRVMAKNMTNQQLFEHISVYADIDNPFEEEFQIRYLSGEFAGAYETLPKVTLGHSVRNLGSIEEEESNDDSDKENKEEPIVIGSK